MVLDPDGCYRALRARDARFDGLFFVGVTTTGVYCRPVCPARTPGQNRCVFFRRPVEAEHAGFRACFRCRPEIAPGASNVDAVSRLVADAMARIGAGALNEKGLEDLAGDLGVTARHLRRAFSREIGASPVEVAQSTRLAFAKQLLHDAELSVAEVAFSSGFSSVRRFNALFRARFGRSPSWLRGRGRAGGASRPADTAPRGIPLTLGFREPFAWDPLLAFLQGRATAGVERVADGTYGRTVRIGDDVGWIQASRVPNKPAIRVRVSPSLAPALMQIAARVRWLLDLDAEPDIVDGVLSRDPALRQRVANIPGLRVPGAFDGFEIAVRAVLGQQISVRAATTLAGRLARTFGEPMESGSPGLDRLFPTAARLAAASEDEVASIGLPGARARTLLELARAVVSGDVRLTPDSDREAAVIGLSRLRGIGPWTAQYVAMRALRLADAFPESDLGLRVALGRITARALAERAEAWRPYRAYAALHLWSGNDAEGGG